MPAVDYKYDYYNSNKKVNKPAGTQRATRKVDSSNLSTSNRISGTRQATKEQVRKAMYDVPKQQRTTSKTSTRTSTNRKKVKVDYNIEIPEVKNGKKVTNISNVKSATQSKKQLQKNNYSKPAEMKLKKPQVSKSQKKKAREKAANRVKNVLYIIAGFAIAFLICYRYSIIDEKFNQLEKTKRELATAQTINEQIQADIDSQTDLSYIENYAKYQLGMQKPSNSQIVYVNVEKEDRILTPITIEEDSLDKNWLDKAYEEIMKFFE